MRIECKASELSARIDEAWGRRREDPSPTCPECEGSRLSEDGRQCWDCSASDYLALPTAIDYVSQTC